MKKPPTQLMDTELEKIRWLMISCMRYPVTCPQLTFVNLMLFLVARPKRPAQTLMLFLQLPPSPLVVHAIDLWHPPLRLRPRKLPARHVWFSSMKPADARNENWQARGQGAAFLRVFRLCLLIGFSRTSLLNLFFLRSLWLPGWTCRGCRRQSRLSAFCP